MSFGLKLQVPEEYERWLYKHQPWERDPERPVLELDAVPLKIPYGDSYRLKLWLPTGDIILPPIAGGSRAFTRASSHRLTVTSAPLTAAPISMAAWFRSSNTTDHQVIMCLPSNSVVSFFEIAANGSAAEVVLAEVADASGGTAAASSSGYTANVWAHACGVFASATDRRAFINGGSKGTNATSRTPASVANLRIGCRATGVGHFDGDIAEAAVWGGTLTDADVAGAFKNVSALLIRPDVLAFYCPIVGNYSPEIDVVGGLNLTVTGAAKSAHPRIFYPPTVRVVTPTETNVTVTPSVGSLVLTGLAPTVTATQHQRVTPGVASLVLNGLAPTVVLPKLVTPGTSSLTLTGLPPVVGSADNKVVTPGVGSLVLTGLAPTVIAPNPQRVTPGVGSLVLTGLVPFIILPRRIVPGVGSLVLTGLAPSVSNIFSIPEAFWPNASASGQRPIEPAHARGEQPHTGYARRNQI